MHASMRDFVLMDKNKQLFSRSVSEKRKESVISLYIAPKCGLNIELNPDSFYGEFGQEYTLNNTIDDFKLSKGAEVGVVKGWLSPMHAITITDEKRRKKAGIPDTAVKYSFLYPPYGLADAIDWTKVSSKKQNDSNNKWALPYIASFGAYAYFDEDEKLICVNAITLVETGHVLRFKGPFVATKGARKEIEAVNRYQPLYLDVFLEVGFVGSAWIDPSDDRYIDKEVDGQSNIRNSHGGFLYFCRDGTAVILFIDGICPKEIPHHAVGSVIRDTFKLCREQLMRDEMNTTCPSATQPKDEIHRACENGCKKEIKYLLKRSGRESFLHKDVFGWTPLHYVCYYHAQDLELIKLVLKYYPDDVLTPNRKNLYPIHLACQNNPSVEVIEVLLEADKDKETIYKKTKNHGFLPIHFACSNSKTSINVIEFLISADSQGRTLYEKGVLGSTPFHQALARNHKHDVIKLLITSASRNIDKYEMNLVHLKANGLLPIHLACLKSCSEEIVSLLLNSDPDNEAFYQTGVTCDEYSLYDSTVIHIALAHASNEIINLILLKEMKVRCKPKSGKIIDLFGMCEGERGLYPIHVACRRKDLTRDVYTNLLRIKRDCVFLKDNEGNTALHHACKNPDIDQEVIEMLLESEVHVNSSKGKEHLKTSAVETKNNDGQYPLSLAVKAFSSSSAEILLQPKYIRLGEMNSEDSEDLLRLVLASKEMQLDVVRNLAQRPYFIFIMAELVANVVATTIYFNVSTKSLYFVPISSVEAIILLLCIFVFTVRELIQLRWSTITSYITDGWNSIECCSIIALFLATYHLVELRIIDGVIPNRDLLIWSGVLLVMQFIFIIRSTFLPFARFVAGLLNIAYTLIPFFVVTLMLLLGFTYCFHMSGGRDDVCPTFGNCLLWTLGGFFYGADDFLETPILDVLFGILGAVILLNVVIAIVSNAWDDAAEETKEVFWESRVNMLFFYRFSIRVSRKSSMCFQSLLGRIDKVTLNSLGDNTSFWRLLLTLVKYFFWGTMGLLTFGILWPVSFREAILCAGMNEKEKESSESTKDE